MMAPHSTLLFALVALCALLAAQDGTNAQVMKKLFGVAAKDNSDVSYEEVASDYVSEVADDSTDEKSAADEDDSSDEMLQQPDEYDAEETRADAVTTTQRPGFFQQFSFPTLPTFSLPSFPTLRPFPTFPSFPSLANMTLHQLNNLTNTFANLSSGLPRPYQRPTIIATQTLFLEVTKRVTRVPVCMTVDGIRPPCNMPRPQQPENQYRSENQEDSLWTNEHQADSAYFIEPTAAYKWSSVEPTLMAAQGEREGKYLELKSSRPIRAKQAKQPLEQVAPSESEVADNADGKVTPALTGAAVGVGLGTGLGGALAGGLGGIGGIGENLSNGISGLGGALGMNHIRPVTSIIRRTLRVTRVETVTDTRVTATMIAANCVPQGINIPFCNSGPNVPQQLSITARPFQQNSQLPTSQPLATWPAATWPPKQSVTTRPTRRPTTKRSTTKRTTTKPITTQRPYEEIAVDGNVDQYVYGDNQGNYVKA